MRHPLTDTAEDVEHARRDISARRHSLRVLRSRRAATDGGLALAGYTTQARFLINCGITELLGHTPAEDAGRYLPMANAVNRLLSPAEMGELFKVMAVGRGVDGVPRGFSSGDRSHAL